MIWLLTAFFYLMGYEFQVMELFEANFLKGWEMPGVFFEAWIFDWSSVQGRIWLVNFLVKGEGSILRKSEFCISCPR